MNPSADSPGATQKRNRLPQNLRQFRSSPEILQTSSHSTADGNDKVNLFFDRESAVCLALVHRLDNGLGCFKHAASSEVDSDPGCIDARCRLPGIGDLTPVRPRLARWHFRIRLPIDFEQESDKLVRSTTQSRDGRTCPNCCHTTGKLATENSQCGLAFHV